MNDEGVRFLRGACRASRDWAGQFKTLDEAWANCSNSEWMVWALEKLYRQGRFTYPTNFDSDDLRRAAADRGIDIEKAITGDSITLGWKRGCNCYAGAPVPCDVLDPFTGRGTTGVVALRFGRNFRGAELQSKYVPMIKRNLNGESPLWVKEEQS